MSKHSGIGILAALATEVLYGCSFVFTKGATDHVDPVSLLGWRFTVALLALLVLVGARVVRLSVTRSALRPLLLLAVLQPLIYYVCETIGVSRTTASESALVLSAIPVGTLCASVLVLGRHPTRRQVLGIGVTLVGVTCTVVAGGLSLGFDAAGYLALLGGVVAYALYTVFADRYAHVSDLDKTFVMVAVGAVMFGSLALARAAANGTAGDLVRLPASVPGFALAIAFLALGSTIGAFYLQNVAIASLGSTRFSTFIGVSTVAGLVMGALVLGERLSPWQLAGGSLILAGVYLANRQIRRNPAAVGGPR